MAFAIDSEIKDRIRSSIDIVDLLGGYMQLRRQGANFVGLCPFHEDRRPSMHVNAARQTWKCWVCDIGGDIFSFLMLREQLSFPEAVAMLAERAGIELPVAGVSQVRGGENKQELLLTMAWVVSQYHRCLLADADAEAARDYLLDRGIDKESIASFQLGYAPQQWNWLTDRFTASGKPLSLLEQVGVVAKSERGTLYDRFRGRVIFPIADPQGRCISLGGRVLPGADRDQAKYVNCSETRLYQKHQQLYGLDQAKTAIAQSRTAVVMEGYTDVIMAAQQGIPNAIAVCGTALGEGHLRVLQRYCDQVVLLLDGDAAGRRRASEILELFMGHSLDLRIVTLPDDLDPCDFLLQHGPDQLRHHIANAIDALEYKVESLLEGVDPYQDTHRANAALEQLISLLARAAAGGDADRHRLRREQMLLRLSKRFGVPVTMLKERLEECKRQTQQRQRTRQTLRTGSAENTAAASEEWSASTSNDVEPNTQTESRTRPAAVVPLRYDRLTAMERELFEIMVQREDLVPVALERFDIACLHSLEGKTLMQIFVDCELQGESLAFESVMAFAEDVQIKSLLVSVETHAAAKHAKLPIDARQRLLQLCETLSAGETLAEQQRRIAMLQSSDLDDAQQLQLLQDIVQSARNNKILKLPDL